MADVTTRTLRPPSAPVHGTLFLPAVADPPAAVLVIGGAGGSEPSYVAEALAREGFAALSVAYFARERLPAQLRGIRLEYFMSALGILVWPSADMARALSRRLQAHGDPHGHAILSYPQAGRALGYLIPDLPAGLLPSDIADRAEDKAARADAWPQVVAFIRQLGPSR